MPASMPAFASVDRPAMSLESVVTTELVGVTVGGTVLPVLTGVDAVPEADALVVVRSYVTVDAEAKIDAG